MAPYRDSQRSGYALSIGESAVIKYEVGEGLIGQAASNGNTLYVDDVPEGYVKIVSGLGESAPRNIIVLPVLFEEQVKGVIELASFEPFSPTHEVFLDQLMESIGSLRH